MTIHRIRRYGSSARFGDFPRSIYVPPREFRDWVGNWWMFIEYLPPFKQVERREVKRETIRTYDQGRRRTDRDRNASKGMQRLD